MEEKKANDEKICLICRESDNVDYRFCHCKKNMGCMHRECALEALKKIDHCTMCNFELHYISRWDTENIGFISGIFRYNLIVGYIKEYLEVGRMSGILIFGLLVMILTFSIVIPYTSLYNVALPRQIGINLSKWIADLLLVGFSLSYFLICGPTFYLLLEIPVLAGRAFTFYKDHEDYKYFCCT